MNPENNSLIKKYIPFILVAIVALAAGGYFIFNRSSVQSTEMKKEPVSTTPSQKKVQMVVNDISIGTGKEVKSGDTVVMHYSGILSDGTKFDSSYDRGQPFETQIGVGRVIKGWDEGVVGMKVGGKRKLIIPPELGYGSQANGSIPANSVLIFELELINVK